VAIAACHGPVRHAETTEKRLALTFDDGPNPPYTERMLEVLARHRVRATFFMIGRNIEMHRASALRVLEEGHEIGNHTYWHRHARFAWPSELREEIARTDLLIRELGYTDEIPFRAPFGEHWGSPALLARPNILYDVPPEPADYHHGDPLKIAANAIDRARPGSVLLFHDGEGIRAESVIAVEETVRELVARGYRFVSLAELFAPTSTSALK
jgi:peptidoglycan/xylan/chitin deacetylase (PgdA/CDA1 family)